MNDYSLKACPKVKDLLDAVLDDLKKACVGQIFERDNNTSGIIKDVLIIGHTNNKGRLIGGYDFIFIVDIDNEVIELHLFRATSNAKIREIVRPYNQAFNKAWEERLEVLKEQGFEIWNKTELHKYTGDEVDLYIPEEILFVIEGCTFKKPLRSFHAHERFVGINEGTFFGQKKLEYVDLGNVAEIPEGAFADCYNLKEIKSINKLKTNKYCFFHCFSLKDANCELDNIDKAFGDTDTFDYAFLTKKDSTYRKHLPDYSNITNHQTFFDNYWDFLQSRAVMECAGIYWLGKMQLVTKVEEFHLNETPKIIQEMKNNWNAIHELSDGYGIKCEEGSYFMLEDPTLLKEMIKEEAEQERLDGKDVSDHGYYVFDTYNDVERHLEIYDETQDWWDYLNGDLSFFVFDNSYKNLDEDELNNLLECLDFTKEFIHKFQPSLIEQHQKMYVLVNKLLNKEELNIEEAEDFRDGFIMLKEDVTGDMSYRIVDGVVNIVAKENNAHLLDVDNSYKGITLNFHSYLFYFGVNGDIRYATTLEQSYDTDRYYDYPYFEQIASSVLYRTNRKEFKKAINIIGLILELDDVVKHTSRKKKDEFHYIWYSCGLEDYEYDFNKYVRLVGETADKELTAINISQIIMLDIENAIREKDFATFMFYYNIAKNMSEDDWYGVGNFYFDEGILYVPALTFIPVDNEENFKKITSVSNQPID